MDASEARHFERFSTEHAQILENVASQKGCNCKPYFSWFTYNRWNAQGRQVRKGEHGVKLTVWLEKERVTKDESGNEKRTVQTFPKSTYVFCQCQTEETK
jgi:antirestriction protein ArdC